jgi:hypothetical protein
VGSGESHARACDDGGEGKNPGNAPDHDDPYQPTTPPAAAHCHCTNCTLQHGRAQPNQPDPGRQPGCGAEDNKKRKRHTVTSCRSATGCRLGGVVLFERPSPPTGRGRCQGPRDDQYLGEASFCNVIVCKRVFISWFCGDSSGWAKCPGGGGLGVCILWLEGYWVLRELRNGRESREVELPGGG